MRIGIAFIFVAVLAAGCSSHDDTDGPVLSQEQVRALVQDNQERMAGEDAPAPNTFLGLSLTAAYDLFVALPVAGYDRMTGYSPKEAAKLMYDPSSADHRREGILELADHRFGRDERYPYVKSYAEIGSIDHNSLVRAAAVRALNRARYRKAPDVYRRALDDTDPFVRLEAAKALANIPDAAAVDLLIKHLVTDPSLDVSIACADALRNFKTLAVARILVGMLGDRDFGVAWQSRQSLILLTGHDYRYDPGRWLEYFDQARQPFI